MLLYLFIGESPYSLGFKAKDLHFLVKTLTLALGKHRQIKSNTHETKIQHENYPAILS